MQSDRRILSSRLALITAVVLLVAVLALDIGIIGRAFTLKSPPDFSAVYLLRMGIIATAAMLIVVAAARHRPAGHSPTAHAPAPAAHAPASRSPIPPNDAPVVFPVSAAAVLTAAIAAYFWANPKSFSTFGSEENYLEWIGQALFFFSTALLIARTIRLRRLRQRARFLLSAGLALVFFLISMEEISWFQRILGIEKPPPIFSGNLQEETNFHNFFTHPVEMSYYTAAFTLLILIPFLNERFRLFDRIAPLAELVPSRTILFLTAPLAFINYADWNRLPEQTGAFLTLFILGYYALRLRTDGRRRELLLVVTFIAILVTAQTLFLLGGENLTRFWQTTEYKELIIAIGFTAYTLQLRRSSKAPA